MIIEIRKEKGVTREELSREAQVNRVTLWRYERGKTIPNATNLKRIAIALNVTMDELISK